MKTQTLGPRTKKIVVLLLLVGVLGFLYYSYFAKTVPITYEYTTATKKDLKKTVEGSGHVVSVSELQIQQLQNSGKVTSVRVMPGDYVKKGQILATLDNRQASIQLAQAHANYNKVLNGSNTPEDLAISNQSIVNAKQSYNIVKLQQDTAVANAKRTLLNTGIAAVPVYDARIQPNSPSISGSYTCNEESEYVVKFTMNDYVSFTATGADQVSGQIRISNVPQALGNCGLYLTFDQSKDYSNGEWKVSIPNKTSTSYATNLNSYNNALQARDIALINASTSIVNAQLSYNQKVAPPTQSDLVAARSSLETAQLSYDNTIIRAPFDGQIGSVSAAVGQQTNSQQGVATIITKDKIAEISLNEIDVADVLLGQSVELSFDAIPGEVFKGSVAQIDTIGVSASNVVSFATKISIPNADERIKSGMSVTANIITSEKDNILTVPSGTIKTEGSGDKVRNYVMKKLGSSSLSSGNFASSTFRNASSSRNFVGKNRTTTSLATDTQNIKVYVTVGLSNDIDTEILDGLNEGDRVVSKTVSNTAAKTATTFSLFGGGARPGAGGTTGGTRNVGR
jgi:multidrug efflux pump subunit AcrA (membrane-fusion protein)